MPQPAAVAEAEHPPPKPTDASVLQPPAEDRIYSGYATVALPFEAPPDRFVAAPAVRFPATGLLVPAFPKGTRLITADADQLELQVTDRRCPPGLDDCLHCNQRWAEWLTNEPPKVGHRDVRPLRARVRPDPAPALPQLGVFKIDGLDHDRGQFRFLAAFAPWPVPVTPAATYELVNASGSVGTTRHVDDKFHCGFFYSCWYGTTDTHSAPPWFALGPLPSRPTTVQLDVLDEDNVAISIDDSIHLRTESIGCFTVGPTTVAPNFCFRSRLEHYGETWERLIGHTDAHHAQPLELCRRPI